MRIGRTITVIEAAPLRLGAGPSDDVRRPRAKAEPRGEPATQAPVRQAPLRQAPLRQAPLRQAPVRTPGRQPLEVRA